MIRVRTGTRHTQQGASPAVQKKEIAVSDATHTVDASEVFGDHGPG